MLTGRELGYAIMEALEQNGYSQADAARYFGISKPSVNGWIKTGRISKSNFLKLVMWLKNTPMSHWGIGSIDLLQLQAASEFEMVLADSNLEKSVIDVLETNGWQVEKIKRNSADTLPDDFTINGKKCIPDLFVRKGDKEAYLEIKSQDFLRNDSPWLQLANEGKVVLITSTHGDEILKQLHEQLAAIPENVEYIRREIKKLDVAGSMGKGFLMPEHEDVVERMVVSEAWLRRNINASNPANLALITGYGDSMEGTFSDGDLLLVDRGVTDIKIDGIFVLALNDELYIKRLQRRPDGSVLMISDNKKYEPYVIQNGEREKFKVLGRVVLAWNSKKL